MGDAPLLELKGMTKRFPGVVANDHVDFELAKGEVHALLGENGAGKSTLMNILYGLYHPDEGEIRLRGKNVRIHSPREAIDLGIGMVHQHFMLIPVMTVAENIVLHAPTAVLTPQEAQELFEILESLKAEGKSIIFISHKLNEVLEVAERITVLRRGETNETGPRGGGAGEGPAKLIGGRGGV